MDVVQVVIIGSGPAGLLLGQLLRRYRRGHNYPRSASTASMCSARVRAGVLEQGTVDLLEQAGVAGRLHAEGLPHHGIVARLRQRALHRLDLSALTGGKHVTVYGQTEVTRDLMEARASRGLADRSSR